MTRKLTLLTILLVAGAVFVGSMEASRAQEGPALMSVHLFNLPSNAREVDLVNMSHDLNQVIADIGFPNAGYKLFRVSGNNALDYNYLWEGTWPSNAAYDEIHNSDQYKAAMEKHRALMDAIRDGQRFNRYVEVTEGMAGR